MCGILYKSNFKRKLNYKEFIDSLDTLKHFNDFDCGALFIGNHALGARKLIINKKEKDIQPISRLNSHLIFDGELYNIDELRKKLSVDTYRADSIMLFELLEKYGLNIINELNGLFSFVYTIDDTVYAVRDMFGIKPLYYSFVDDELIVASEIKAILKFKKEVVVDKNGVLELLAMGPSHSQGKTIYKDIYEVKPGNYLKYTNGNLEIKEYYKLKAYDYNLSYKKTVELVKNILDNAIKNQLNTDTGASVFLSGGLDSSIVSTVASRYIPNIDAFNLQYKNNNFEINDFETSIDTDYAKKLASNINCNLHEVIIDDDTLTRYLDLAVIAKDGPGMTDIDSSLLYLAENIKAKNNVALSGECSDEIFGGYKWYYEKNREYKTFPWIRNIELRENLINKSLKLDLKKYIEDEYQNAILEVPIGKNDTDTTKKERIMFYLNIRYFMTNLLDRNDRMLMYNGVEGRVPFCDKNLVELLYNIPFKYKYRYKVEKRLLRDAYKNELPKDIINRKKSPYPKSHSKVYEEKVICLVKKALEDETSILHILFDINAINELIASEELSTPWYGQLMRKTSMLAYIYQIHYWGKIYNIKLEL